MAWTTGFSLFRDALQFAVMLVLVRLLPAEVYGQFGFLTTVLGLLTLVSFREYLNHTLQIRGGQPVPYQDHFTAGLVIQIAVFLVANLAALGLRALPDYAALSPVLHVMSVLFLLDLPSEFRVKMLERSLDWRRLRTLHAVALVAGALLSVAMAMRGWGVYALLVPTLLVPLPFIYDLFVAQRWRPQWGWSWARFEPAWRFGSMRIAAGSFVSGALFLESAWLSWGLGFAAFGIFGRAVGLAQLLCGRVAGLLALAIYPVLTRIPLGTDEFRRASAIYLRTTAWLVIPAAAGASLLAGPIVTLLYGERWIDVVPLLAYAMWAGALAALVQTGYTLLLAHGRQDRCLLADAWRLVGTVGALAIGLPFGVAPYLLGLAAVQTIALVAVTLWLYRERAVTAPALLDAFLPPVVGVLGAGVAVAAVRALGLLVDGGLASSVLVGLLFGLIFVAVLRTLHRRPLMELVGYMPQPHRIAQLLRLPEAA